MRKAEYLFIVNLVQPGDSGRMTAIGRCGDFPIRVHDEFDSIFVYHPRKHPAESGKAPERDVVRTVCLRVVELEAYGRSFQEFGQGQTGAMVLEGEGIDLVAPGWILGTFDGQPPKRLESLAPAVQTTAV